MTYYIDNSEILFAQMTNYNDVKLIDMMCSYIIILHVNNAKLFPNVKHDNMLSIKYNNRCLILVGVKNKKRNLSEI